MQDEGKKTTIAVLGGTGKEGSGLALRWARHGHRVIIGSREAERAVSRAEELNAQHGVELVGMANTDAAAAADLVVLSVPYSAHQATLESVRAQLDGKILVDLTVPLKPPKVRRVHLPAGESAALEAQSLLGDSVQVVAAFQNVSAEELADPAHTIDCDVLICGDNAAAREAVAALAEAAGMRGIHAGPLANAVAVESLTPVLLFINNKYGIKGSGIRITGVN